MEKGEGLAILNVETKGADAQNSVFDPISTKHVLNINIIQSYTTSTLIFLTIPMLINELD